MECYFACELYGVDLVGGDTTSSPRGMTLSITAIGKCEKMLWLCEVEPVPEISSVLPATWGLLTLDCRFLKEKIHLQRKSANSTGAQWL